MGVGVPLAATLKVAESPTATVWLIGWVPIDGGEFTVIDPLAQHELILVLNVGVDEIPEQPALDAVISLGRIIDRAVRHAASDQAVGVIAAAGMTLACDRLASWIDAAHVGPDRTAQPLWIARSIRVHVFEVV